MRTFKEKFGARIQEIRKSQKLTQEKLAEAIGLDIPNLSNIERGKRFVSSDTLEKIVKALGVSEKELFDFGHLKNRQELLTEIDSILNSASDEDIKYYYRFMILHREKK